MSGGEPTGAQPPQHTGAVAGVLVLLVRGYQLVLSPWIPQRCRFHPSCSAYAVTALRTHGAARGTWLAARRLGRCHPWNPGGVDHVPGTAAARAWRAAHPTDLPSATAPADPRSLPSSAAADEPTSRDQRVVA